MDDAGEVRDDLKVPESDIGKEIVEKFEKDEGIMVSQNIDFFSQQKRMKVISSFIIGHQSSFHALH